MNLFWTPEALADRLAIYDHIEADDPGAALSLDEQFSAAAQRLTDYPYLGRPGRVAFTRELVAHQNYVLVYDMGDDKIRVLKVLHVARRWPVAERRV